MMRISYLTFTTSVCHYGVVPGRHTVVVAKHRTLVLMLLPQVKIWLPVL